MDKTTKMVLIGLAILILILAAAVSLVYKNMNFGSDNSKKEVIDTLEVTYWDSRGDPMVIASYPEYFLSDYVNNSVLIVSATVIETDGQWDTSDGQPPVDDPEHPWIVHYYNKECYLKVNEVLKGNFDINQIYLRTDAKTPEFAVGETYVLFIARSEQSGNYYYQLFGTEGYLLKTDSDYIGGIGNVTEKELTSAIKKSK